MTAPASIPDEYAQRATLTVGEVVGLTGFAKGAVLRLVRRGELHECSLGGRRLILASSLWNALRLTPNPEPDAVLLAEVEESFEKYRAKEAARCSG